MLLLCAHSPDKHRQPYCGRGCDADDAACYSNIRTAMHKVRMSDGVELISYNQVLQSGIITRCYNQVL